MNLSKKEKEDIESIATRELFPSDDDNYFQGSVKLSLKMILNNKESDVLKICRVTGRIKEKSKFYKNFVLHLSPDGDLLLIPNSMWPEKWKQGYDLPF